MLIRVQQELRCPNTTYQWVKIDQMICKGPVKGLVQPNLFIKKIRFMLFKKKNQKGQILGFIKCLLSLTY